MNSLPGKSLLAFSEKATKMTAGFDDTILLRTDLNEKARAMFTAETQCGQRGLESVIRGPLKYPHERSERRFEQVRLGGLYFLLALQAVDDLDDVGVLR